MGDREFNSASFFRFLSEKKLMASKCRRCEAIYLPPHPLCRGCYSDEMEWVEMKGKGKLAAFTVVAVGPTFMVAEGFDRKNTYCTGVVELEEGPKISARILGVDVQNPDRIKVGTPLTIEFLEVGKGESKQAVVAFKA